MLLLDVVLVPVLFITDGKWPQGNVWCGPVVKLACLAQVQVSNRRWTILSQHHYGPQQCTCRPISVFRFCGSKARVAHSSVRYTIFSLSHSEPSGAFSEIGGRGAVCGGVGFTSVATVVAMDRYRNRRTRGGDNVQATITWTRIDGSRHRCMWW